MRIPIDRLTIKALLALEEIAARSHDEAAPRSMSLRFTLAYLYGVSHAERWMFDQFWYWATRDAIDPCDNASRHARSGNVCACLNGIYRAVGVTRTSAMQYYGMEKERRAKKSS